MSAAFTRKRLDLTITLGTGQFGDTVGDSVSLSRLRMSAELINPGGDTMGQAQLRVFGLKESMMNQITTIGYVGSAIKAKNSIQLAAGDDETGVTTIFIGTIYDAWAEYNSAPEVAFNVLANAGLDALVKPVDAISFKGSTSAAQIMAGLADKMGLQFENNSVDAQLSNPYFPGTALMQVRACARAANIYYRVDNGVLAIWTKDGSRKGDIPIISKETGLVGYPSLNSKGMAVKTLFNPNIKSGGEVMMKSSMANASGQFHVFDVAHSLSSETPDGPWFTNFGCSNVKL